MVNISASFTLPCPKTACYKALFWTAQSLRLRDFEISDHKRRVIQTTINLDRAMNPAATLRRRLSDRLDRQPNTGDLVDKFRQHYHRSVCVHSTHLNTDSTTGLKYLSTLRAAGNTNSALQKGGLVFNEDIWSKWSTLPWSHHSRKHSNTAHQSRGSTSPQQLWVFWSIQYKHPPFFFMFDAHCFALSNLTSETISTHCVLFFAPCASFANSKPL